MLDNNLPEAEKLTLEAKALLKDQGVFICSGIARERENDTLDALKKAGYTRLDIRHQGEWTAIACRE